MRPVAAKSRMHAGDEIDGLIDAQPGGQHRDVGDEAGVMHQRGALAQRLATQHLQLPFVGGQPQDGAQRGGLTGAVRADEPDDAAGFDREIGAIQRDVRSILFCQITSFYQRRHDGSHSSLGSLPRGGGAGWVSAGVCANNSCEENPSR